MQKTQVWSLGWEDPTCYQTTKPVPHSYWASALEPISHDYWSPHLEPAFHKKSYCNEKPANCWAHTLEPVLHSACSTRELTSMRSLHTTVKSSPCSQQLEKAHAKQQGPSTAKSNKQINSKWNFLKKKARWLKFCFVMINRVPEELWTKIHNIVQEVV